MIKEGPAGAPQNILKRKTAGTAENPTHQQTTLCDILINITVPQAYVQSPTTENMGDLDFDLSMLLKIKLDSVI